MNSNVRHRRIEQKKKKWKKESTVNQRVANEEDTHNVNEKESRKKKQCPKLKWVERINGFSV